MLNNPRYGDPFANKLYRVRNAIVQELRNIRNVTYVTVSYTPPVPRGTIQTMVLVVTNQTLIRNTYGRILTRRQIRLGMTLDADVSPAMTASMPPQVRAIRITILPPASSYHIILGVILQINSNSRQILVGSLNDPSSQIRLNISPSTVILNQRGNQIPFGALRLGQLVRADHSTNQTFSIPPQANAYRIRVL